MFLADIKFGYRDVSEIHNLISHFIDYGFFKILLLIIVFLFSIALLQYVLPGYLILQKSLKVEKEKISKKLVLKQIIIQKQIETEIENEIKIQQEVKFQKQKSL